MPRIAYVLDPAELTFSAMRAQGAGGQNVNKVSSAVMLRFDVRHSSLPGALKQRVLALSDQRITADGVLVIKAQEHRSQAMNRAAALHRLHEVLDAAAQVPLQRVATRPTRASVQRRVQSKQLRAGVKALRARPIDD